MHSKGMLGDHGLRDGAVVAKLALVRFFSSMLNQVQFEHFVGRQPFGTLWTLVAEKRLVLLITMPSQHASSRKFLVTQVTFEDTVRIVLHVSMI